MADTKIHPDFKAFAALQNEPAKGSLDPNRRVEQTNADQARKDDSTKRKKKQLSISQYQDPRDQLDHERHAKLAMAREEAKVAKHSHRSR